MEDESYETYLKAILIGVTLLVTWKVQDMFKEASAERKKRDKSKDY